MPQEEYIEFGDQRFLRSRARSCISLSTPTGEPPVRAVAAEDAPARYWQDGKNPDLLHVKFVLDTEGYNANWDYMPRDQLIASHGTAIFKPVDMEHVIKEDASMTLMSKDDPPVRNTICGVMTGTVLAWAKTGTPLTTKELADLPRDDVMERPDDQKIAVVAHACLYSFLFPKTVASLVQAIDDDEIFVSMERWIGQHDYLVYDPGTKAYAAVTREDAIEQGIADKKLDDGSIQGGKWTRHECVHGKPVYRRSLSYVYGGVANTDNPANKHSRFLDVEAMTKAAASHKDNRVMQALMRTHDEIHGLFKAAATADRAGLIHEHTQVTQAIARLLKTENAFRTVGT